MSIEPLKEAFAREFGRQPDGVVRAPGRVNLIGEHTDYNDGFVLPIAIEKQITAAWAHREDRKIAFASRQADETDSVDLDAAIVAGKVKWANYCRGVAAGLADRGVALGGADILFDSDIPLGAGLSSSAALEVCTAMALLASAGAVGAMPDQELALLCQQAENEFAGAPCGIMDQSISVMGRPGRALLLDCRTGQTEQIPFDDADKVLLVVDTRVKHDIGEGGYSLRRRQCEAAAGAMGVAALRDATEEMIATAAGDGRISQTEHKRARHVVGEIARTLEAAAALKAGDLARFGELMVASHTSLRDDFEVSCEELDAVVNCARACEGVLGARMTGGGFGGSVIVLVAADRADAVGRAIADDFEQRFGGQCGIFATRAAGGAGVVE